MAWWQIWKSEMQKLHDDVASKTLAEAAELDPQTTETSQIASLVGGKLTAYLFLLLDNLSSVREERIMDMVRKLVEVPGSLEKVLVKDLLQASESDDYLIVLNKRLKKNRLGEVRC